jgi:hypothetical protein
LSRELLSRRELEEKVLAAADALIIADRRRNAAMDELHGLTTRLRAVMDDEDRLRADNRRRNRTTL